MQWSSLVMLKRETQKRRQQTAIDMQWRIMQLHFIRRISSDVRCLRIKRKSSSKCLLPCRRRRRNMRSRASPRDISKGKFVIKNIFSIFIINLKIINNSSPLCYLMSYFIIFIMILGWLYVACQFPFNLLNAMKMNEWMNEKHFHWTVAHIRCCVQY